MQTISIILLGLAVSMDGFSVGFACGLRRVHLPPASLLIICLSSAASIFISMTVGCWLARFVSREAANYLGGVMLIVCGLFVAGQTLRAGRNGKKGGADRCSTGGKSIRFLAEILREPSRADFDRSGIISGREAAVLGAALAMDAFTGGFGAALMGFSPLAVVMAVGTAKFFLLGGGLIAGRQCAHRIGGQKATLLAGAVLVLIGIMRVFS
ncbi:MAG: sporulation membrane protein YtaF [Firmicutes bacterium]|nr:sporulation membrane protein YtaF [Bacillota bacterium]